MSTTDSLLANVLDIVQFDRVQLFRFLETPNTNRSEWLLYSIPATTLNAFYVFNYNQICEYLIPIKIIIIIAQKWVTVV